MKIANITTGFIEVPGQISLNIYAQGCKKSCKECHNPELHTFNGGKDINESQFELILKEHSLPTWVCWLGGDATYQPDSFKSFNKIIKSTHCNICLYTGQYFDDIKELIEDVDLVIDGPYEGKMIKESNTGQRVYLKMGTKWIVTRFGELEHLLK